MKKAAAAFLVFLLSWFCAVPGVAESPEEIMDWMISVQIRKAGQSDLQGWVDTALAEGIGGNGGWYIIGLDRAGYEFDPSACRRMIRAETEKETGSITKKLRNALTMQALGVDNGFPGRVLAEAAAQDSLMTLIFACHLRNNGVPGGEDVADRLLDLQKEDGGWAVIGENADPDCTAMALQALSPLYGKEERVTAAADRGLEVLSRMQLPDGGYSGMGLESSESCAQVVLALSCFQIDSRTDPRFVKEGGSVMDALLSFRREDGGFAHGRESAESNETATVQAFTALAGYRRMLSSGGPCYVFEAKGGSLPEAEEGRTNTAAPVPRSGGILPRGPMYAVIGAAVLIACLIAVIRKKRNWRTYVFIAALGCAAAVVVALTEIRTPESYYAAPARTEGNSISTGISIRCDTVAGKNEWAPEDGTILEQSEIRIGEGQTAFDQLLEATRLNHIQMEYDGTAEGAYIRGIGYLYEYEFGSLSGWMYRVNGTLADTGASRCVLSEGDLVEWVYTTDIGRDVN